MSVGVCMEILAIETSGSQGSVALYRDSRPVTVEEFPAERAHNSALFAPLGKLLEEARGVDLLVVGTGPGSYSGVRVGIAAAMGVSIARGVPLVGVPSVCGLAHAVGEPCYAVCGDARRGMWWWAVVREGAMAEPPVVESAEVMARRCAGWGGHIFTMDAGSPPFCHATPSSPRAEILAALAEGLSDESIAAAQTYAVEPIYLAAPFVTVSRKPVFR